jgi:hypothetical protein
MTLLSPLPTTISWKVKTFFLFLLWLLYPLKTKKSWKECLFGAIPHECEFDKPSAQSNSERFVMAKCKHYGCNIVKPYFYYQQRLNN